jgi:uncharacterized membrane protein
MTDVTTAELEERARALSRGLEPKRRRRDHGRSAEALGYLSIGLGLAGVMFARSLNRWMGIRHPRGARLTRAVGARELLTGARLLTGRRPARWLWARVAGDLLDLSLLGGAFLRAKRGRGRVLTAMAAVGGITAIDLLAARGAPKKLPALAPNPVGRAITISVPPEQAYAFWRELENLPAFMPRLVSVTPLDPQRSRWCARGPAGKLLEWEAVIVEDVPDELIRWHSVPGAAIQHRGSVRFRPAPGLRGTEVSLEVQYEAPAGELGRRLSALTNEAVGLHMQNGLRHLKQILEVGEVVQSDASAHPGLNPARPKS